MPRKITTEIFIKRANIIHNNYYNYSKTKYINMKTKINIICPIHNLFQQQAGNHIEGKGCFECKGNHRLTKKIFIEKSNKIHNNKYDYSDVKYINNKTKVKIICPLHKEFYQKPDNHMMGQGCHPCYYDSMRDTKEIFIQKSNKIHFNKYEYSKVNYKNSRTKVEIICSKHNSFYQTPDSHLRGKGCSKCNTLSKAEIYIKNYFKKYNIKFKEQYIFKNQPKNIEFCRYDFYLPDINLVIEYHGKQHFIFVNFFHNEFLDFLDRVKRDYDKMKFCKNNNINFLEIHYNQDINKILFNLRNTLKRETP